MQEHLEQTKVMLRFVLVEPKATVTSGSRRWRPLTFHATSVLLKSVASGALFLCLFAARRGYTALRWKGSMVCWNEVLPAPRVILANPFRTTSLGTGRNYGHGLLHGAGLHLPSHTWQKATIQAWQNTRKQRPNISSHINHTSTTVPLMLIW